MKEILEELSRNLQHPRDKNARYAYVEQEALPYEALKFRMDGSTLRYSIIKLPSTPIFVQNYYLDFSTPVTDKHREILREKLLFEVFKYGVFTAQQIGEDIENAKTTNSK